MWPLIESKITFATFPRCLRLPLVSLAGMMASPGAVSTAGLGLGGGATMQKEAGSLKYYAVQSL